MKTIIAGCKTLEAEIRQAQRNKGTDYPLEVIESGLHERPKKLAEAVNDLFHSVNADRVLMCLGQCGNSLIGLKTGNFELIMPKADDCISVLFGSTKQKGIIASEDKAFFLTKGWLQGESTIMSQYAYSIEKYGEEAALKILEMMYAHYSTLGLIDTGTEPMDELYVETEKVAQLLNLKRKTYKGTLEYIEQLLTGPWTQNRFIVKKPFNVIEESDYRDFC